MKKITTLFLLLLCLHAPAQVTYPQLLAQIEADLKSQMMTTNAAIQTTSMFPPEWGNWPKLTCLTMAGLFAVFALLGSFYTVQTQEVAIIERFGKFRRKTEAGLRFKIPFLESVADRLSLMLEQHQVKITSLTKDKVTVSVIGTVQYRVIQGREYDAYYLLDDPTDQIHTFFFDIMRAQIPVMTLDELYATKDTISNLATMELEKDMTQFGYMVPRVLITTIEPDEKVKAAMNDINSAQRESQAAVARGEAEKIKVIKAAEAQAESDRLRGKGLADQRIEIAKGFKQSVDEMKAAAPNTGEKQILAILTMVQHIEMMEKMASYSKSNVIFTDHSPGAVNSLRQQIMEGLVVVEK